MTVKNGPGNEEPEIPIVAVTEVSNPPPSAPPAPAQQTTVTTTTTTIPPPAPAANRTFGMQNLGM